MDGEDPLWESYSTLQLLQFLGRSFERPAKISELKIVVETATYLHLNAAVCARLMRRYGAGTGGAEAARAAKWLRAVREDLAVVEENARRALRRAKTGRR